MLEHLNELIYRGIQHIGALVQDFRTEGIEKMLKGYPTDSGYYDYVNGKYMLFETEKAYYEYMEGIENDKNRIL